MSLRQHRRFPARTSVPRSRLSIPVRLILLAEVLLVARLTVLQRRREDFTAIDAFAMVEIVIVAAIGLLLALQSGQLWRLWQRIAATSGKVLLAFFALALVSAAWSELPKYSAFRAGEFAVLSLGFLVAVASARTFAHAERLILVLGMLALGLAAFSIVLSRGGASFELHNNTVGASAVILTCYAVGEALRAERRRRRNLVVLSAISAALTLASQSLASWWSLFIGVGVAFLLSKSARGGFVLVVVVLGLAVALVGAERFEPVVDPYGQTEEAGKLETFTGRKLLWEGYEKVFKASPWLGVGYAVAARTAGPVYATNTHNAAWAVLLGTGVVGMTIVVIAALFGLREALSACAAGRTGAVGATAALVAGSANSMSLSLFGEGWGVASFVFMLFYAFHLCAVARPQWVGRVEQQATRAASRRDSWKNRSRKRGQLAPTYTVPPPPASAQPPPPSAP